MTPYIFYVVVVVVALIAWAIWQKKNSLSAAVRATSPSFQLAEVSSPSDGGVVVQEVAPQIFEVRVTRHRHLNRGRAGHRRRRREAVTIKLGTIKATNATDAERQAQERFYPATGKNLRLHLCN